MSEKVSGSTRSGGAVVKPVEAHVGKAGQTRVAVTGMAVTG